MAGRSGHWDSIEDDLNKEFAVQVEQLEPEPMRKPDADSFKRLANPGLFS